jgi:hypothetical protein
LANLKNQSLSVPPPVTRKFPTGNRHFVNANLIGNLLFEELEVQTTRTNVMTKTVDPFGVLRGLARYLRHCLCRLTLVLTLLALQSALGQEPPNQPSQPSPLLEKGHPVDWWFVFKFNAATFPGCSTAQRSCLFGGSIQPYKSFSQQFVYASSEHDALQKGSDCLGDSLSDPVAATFDEVYNGSLFYVIWNDQFYNDPMPSEDAPAGHSKGMLAWNDAGEGLVMQVSTPSWPAAGNPKFPRKTDGNTLGCVKDNDVQVSQHFFALRLSEDDVLTLLKALENASVVTDPNDPQIVHNGGPAKIQAEVVKLGDKSNQTAAFAETLSTGVEVISKPSGLHVPPWQLVSSILGGVSLRAATWWTKPAIPTTTADATIGCWNDSLSKPGAVEIATTGEWDGTVIGLKGGLGTNFNHAKIGVATSGTKDISIFGDMNQQGALSGKCTSSQNGRGGLFYVVKDQTLAKSITALLNGDTAPSQ